MPVKFTNKTGINLPMAIWLLNDKYDHVKEENYISATGLLKPLKALILAEQNISVSDLIEIDISNRAQAQDGTAMHSAIDDAWKNKYAIALACELVGISKELADSIIINPTPTHIEQAKARNELITPVYMEKRVIKEIAGFKVGGKYDLVLAGDLHDHKKTGTYTYTHQKNAKKYIQQGSIYRWLNPDIILSDTLTINYFFTDWKQWKTTEPKYPLYRIMSQHFEMMSYDETEKFIVDILTNFTKYKDRDQKDLPLCTKEELWQDPTEYKYFKNPTASRATKNFGTDLAGANLLLATNRCGIVKPIPGVARACNYCSALPFCDQAAFLLKTNQLVLT